MPIQAGSEAHIHAFPHLSMPDGLFQLTDLGLYCVLVSQDVCQALCQLILRAKKEVGVILTLQRQVIRRGVLVCVSPGLSKQGSLP